MTKLTISMDKAVVAQAKRIAKANNTNVSSMFSRYVRSLSAKNGRPTKVGPLTRKLTGIARLPHGKSYQDAVGDALAAKYEIP